MDIPRADLQQRKNRRRWFIGAVLIAIPLVAAVGLGAMGDAAPAVPSSSVLIATVKRGDLLLEVRGPGNLAPREIRWIATETAARVETVKIKPGAAVEPDTVILELSNPELINALAAAKAAIAAARADLAAKRNQLRSQLLDQRSTFARARSDYAVAKAQEEAERSVAIKGIIPAVQYQKSLISLEQFKLVEEIENERVVEFERYMASQLDAERARVNQVIAAHDLLKRQVDALQVRAGIRGVLQLVPVDEGQQVQAGTNIARVARPDELIAELRIPETQAKDIAIGQKATIDLRSSVVDGKVLRVDPAVVNGTVQVDVAIDGQLPVGARPDLSIDGTISIDRLAGVLHVTRPSFAQPNATLSIFKVDSSGRRADRVQISAGRTSVNEIEIRAGLAEGDRIVVSDMSRVAAHQLIRLK